MLCRLCLKDLVENIAAPHFSGDKGEESPLTKLIAKHFYVELTPDDVSTQICYDCWTHLDEFHRFCVYVERQQRTLHEFLDVKSDSALDVLPEPIADVLADHVGEDETLLDIKDVVLLNFLPETLVADEEEFGFASNSLVPAEAKGGVYEEAAVQHSDADNDAEGASLINLRECNKTVKCKSFASLPLEKKHKKPKTISGIKIKKDTARKLLKKTEPERKTLIEDECLPSEPSTKKESLEDGGSEDEQKAQTQKTSKFDETDKLIANYTQLKCDICKISLETFTKLRQHFNSLHNMSGYVECCDRRFTNRQILVDHIYLHLNPDFFQCKLCNKTLKSSKMLGMHMMNNHSNTEDFKHKCSVCDMRFPHRQSLNNHRLKHQRERNLTCTLCEKAFYSKYDLDCHIRAIHENICPHVCDFCGRAFKYKPSFLQHVAEHKGIEEPRVQCNICGVWLKNKMCLATHTQRHNGPQKSPCEHCGAIFSTKNCLRRHIKWKHATTPMFQCSFCEKSFNRKITLREHVATHTGEKHYTCPHCPREFRANSNMYVHIKSKHHEKWIQAKNAKNAPLETGQLPVTTID